MPALARAVNQRPLRIGLSARLLHKPPVEMGFENRTLQYLEQSIAHWIMAHDALVFMVPTIEVGGGVFRRHLSVKHYVAALDGLVLQGGSDVDPRAYGEQPLRPEWSGDAIRDQYEAELFWEFVIQQKPVLGICRGHQLINVALGGSLYQDIGTQCPGALLHHAPGYTEDFSHRISILPDSPMAALYPGIREACVTSIHHQAIKELGNDLTVDAVSSEDGVIEAVSWHGTGYVRGVQWHPEIHTGASPLLDSAPVILDFLNAAREMK